MSFSLNDFSSTYFAPAIIILGTIGDVFGLIVESKKKLKKIGPQIIYMALFTSDFITFATIFQPYAAFRFNIDVTLFSNIACKSYFYLSYVLASISPMLNVYITVESISTNTAAATATATFSSKEANSIGLHFCCNSV